MRTSLPTSMRGIILAFTAAAAACGGAKQAPPPVVVPADTRAGAKEARDVLEEAMASIRRGEVDGVQTMLATDALVVAPGGQVFTARGDAIVALVAAVAPKKKHRVTASELSVVASPAGHAAWAVGRLDLDGASFRVSAVLAETDRIWSVVALHVGSASAHGAPGAGGGAPAPLPPVVDPPAKEAAQLFQRGAAAPEEFALQLVDREDAVILDPGAHDATRGAKAIRKLWSKRPGGRPAAAPEKALAARVTPDNSLAWVAANVPPFRYLTVYERAPDGLASAGRWRLVAMHASAPAGGRAK